MTEDGYRRGIGWRTERGNRLAGLIFTAKAIGVTGQRLQKAFFEAKDEIFREARKSPRGLRKREIADRPPRRIGAVPIAEKRLAL